MRNAHNILVEKCLADKGGMEDNIKMILREKVSTKRWMD
jgi:hypothetical protein